MASEVLTFHGSALELLAWVALAVFWTAGCFALGWGMCDVTRDEEAEQ